MSFEDGGPIVRERLRAYDARMTAIAKHAPAWAAARKQFRFNTAVRAAVYGTATDEDRQHVADYLDRIKDGEKEDSE